MEHELKNIHHDLLNINVSKYEQSSDLQTTGVIPKNKYFKPRGSVQQPLSKSPSSEDTEQNYFVSLFELLVYEMEKNFILDKECYKTDFKKQLTDESLKEICKQHKVLRRDLHTFIEETTFNIPSNDNVILYFCNLLKTHIYIVKDTMYSKYTCFDETVNQVAVIKDARMKHYSSVDQAEIALISDNCIDSCVFDSKTKFNVIKDYVLKHKIMIPLVDCKNRTTLVNYLKKLNINKN